MVYYHVWDNYPYPNYNRTSYIANDHIACISKLTHDIVQTVAPEVESTYLPHAVEPDTFKIYTQEQIEMFKKQKGLEDKFVCFWNSRNARRKQSGTVIWWFKEFLDRVGHDKATLIMHTDVKDHHGQDLEAIIHELGLTRGEVQFSQEKVSNSDLAMVYNVSDLTIAISDAEGFGLSTLESLACGTPILVNMTGGLQFQVTDGTDWFGIGLEPASKSVIGSQEVPYIYEDRLNKDDFIDALVKLYEMPVEERNAMGAAGREYVSKEFNFDSFIESWDELLMNIHNKHGSWDMRTNYKSYDVRTY